MRIAGTEDSATERGSQASADLKHLLGNHISVTGMMAEVPLDRLESLAKKVGGRACLL